LIVKETPHDRVGDRVRVDLILAATDLLLNLAQAHVAFPFPYRRRLPYQLWPD